MKTRWDDILKNAYHNPRICCSLNISFISSFTFLLCWDALSLLEILYPWLCHLLVLCPHPFWTCGLISEVQTSLNWQAYSVTRYKAVLFMDCPVENSSHDGHHHSSKCGLPQESCRSLFACLYFCIIVWHQEAII